MTDDEIKALQFKVEELQLEVARARDMERYWRDGHEALFIKLYQVPPVKATFTGGVNLREAIKHWRGLSELKLAIAVGKIGACGTSGTDLSADAQTSGTNQKTARISTGGPLNPEWCEWFMGFPIGWTELAHWATPSSRKSPRPSPAPSSKRSGG